MGEKIYKLTDEQEQLLFGDLTALLQALVDAKVEWKELGASFPKRESLDEATEKITQSQESLKGIYKMIRDYFSKEVARVTELEDKYKDLSEDTDNAILGKKEMFQEMLNEVIQEAVKDIDLGEVNTEKMEELFEAKFKEIYLKPLIKFVTDGEKSVLKAFDTAMKSKETIGIVSSKVEDLQETIRTAIDTLDRTATHKMEMLNNRSAEIAESSTAIEELLSNGKLEDIEKRLAKTEKVNKRTYNNFYVVIGLLGGITLGKVDFLEVGTAIVEKLSHLIG